MGLLRTTECIVKIMSSIREKVHLEISKVLLGETAEVNMILQQAILPLEASRVH